jgi:HEAT repeat protein
MKIFVSALIATLLASPQVRDRAATPPNAAAAESDAAALARGWAAVVAGQYVNGARAAETILGRRPWDRAALTLKIGALSAAAPLSGLDAYEQWIAAKHKEDPALLEPVAIATLQEIAKGKEPEVQRRALTALSIARVPGAREGLAALPDSPETVLARQTDAARNGDQAALQRLIGDAATPTGASPQLARALEEIGMAGEPGLLFLLKSSTNPDTRSIAVQALGNTKSDRAREALQPLFDEIDPRVRLTATIALAKMGDPRALDRVDQMLASNVPNVQIAAAEAWEGRPGPWVAVVRPLLDNPDGVTRIDAARVLAPIEPEASRRVLEAGLSDLNPVIRLESARAIDGAVDILSDAADIPALRQRLRDPDASVRLTVASTLLKLARS